MNHGENFMYKILTNYLTVKFIIRFYKSNIQILAYKSDIIYLHYKASKIPLLSTILWPKSLVEASYSRIHVSILNPDKTATLEPNSPSITSINPSLLTTMSIPTGMKEVLFPIRGQVSILNYSDQDNFLTTR